MTLRLDAALAARGLARSRTQASALIADGLVAVDGRTIVKPSAPVAETAQIVVAGTDHYVGRAAHKLVAALDAFPVDPRGRSALDMGASTGGFTQVLLERGVRLVAAVDVGHGQLDAGIEGDPRVRAVEGYNVRDMTPENLAAVTGIAGPPDLITGDLSFISLGHVLPAVERTAAVGADILLLVKPQFEVGRTAVKGGLVTDPTLRADAVAGVLWRAFDLGLGTFGVIASPLVGTHGNAEYIAWLRAVEGTGAGNPTEWLDTVNRLTGAA